MAITAKELADGQLPNAKATLYTCPAATETVIPKGGIRLCNTDASDRTVYLFVKPGGTSREIEDGLILGAKHVYTNPDVITLEAGGLIEGYADVAVKVTYVISGAEET